MLTVLYTNNIMILLLNEQLFKYRKGTLRMYFDIWRETDFV